MSEMNVPGYSGETCRGCGEPALVDGASVRHVGTDPLQVFECVHCGAVLDIGGHRW